MVSKGNHPQMALIQVPVRPWRQRGVGRDRKKLVALIQVSELI